jgi:hypothetical protein
MLFGFAPKVNPCCDIKQRMKNVFALLIIVSCFTFEVNANISCQGLLAAKGELMAPLDFSESAPAKQTSLPPEEPSFSVPIRSKSERVTVKGSRQKPRPNSVLNLTERPFSENLDQALLELVRAFLVTPGDYISEKEVFNKGKLSLGFRISSKYSVQINYTSSSLTESRFIPESITLLLPGGKTVLAKDFMDKELSKPTLKTTSISLDGKFPPGYDVTLDVPLVIGGDLLSRFKTIVDYFESFPRDKQKAMLEKIFASNSLKSIKAKLVLQSYKEVLLKQIVKEPFKNIFTIAIVVLGPTLSGNHNQNGSTAPQRAPVEVTSNAGAGGPVDVSFVTQRLNEIQIPVNNPVLASQISQLKAEITRPPTPSRPEAQSSYSATPNSLEIASIPRTDFARSNLMWIYETPNGTNPKQKDSFIVFANEPSRDTGGSGYQDRTASSGNYQSAYQINYVLLKIDPVKYSQLIAYMAKP